MMMLPMWEMSWLTTGLLIAITFGGLTTLIVLALHDADDERRG
jgi:predicted outer membrane lipoprotein